MQFLARLSLKNRAVVALLTLVIAAGGLYSMASLKQELIPDIEFGQTTIMTTAPGASSEVVDERIAQPLAGAFENISGVESVTSTSSPSLAMITVASAYGEDQARVEADLRKAIDSVSDELPEGTEPQLMAGSVADIPAVMLTVSSPAAAEDLSSGLRDAFVPEIARIDGVREVSVAGGATERITITPDDDALAAAGLTSQAFADALEANGQRLPAGSLLIDDENVSVTAGQAVETLEALRELPLVPTAPPAAAPQDPLDPEAPQAPPEPAPVLTIDDVADVAVATEDASSITRTNGEPSVSVTITKTPDADVVRLSHAISEAVPEATAALEAGLGAEAEATVIFDQAPFVEESIRHLAIEGALGLLFAVVVILLFLFSLRATIVTAISIPLSVLVTFAGLHVSGYTLNMLTLGALTISVGRVVDDSIVVIENIKRHLSYGERKSAAVFTAVREVAGAITSSTLATVVVFLPIVFVSDAVGELFRPFSLTVTIAMLSSLLVALTIVPVLAYWFMKAPAGDVDADAVRREAEAKETGSKLQRAYVPLLRRTQRHPVITLIAAVAILVGTGAMVPALKVDFLGSTGSNSVMVNQDFDASASLEAISRDAADTEDALLGVDGVESVLLTVGGDGFSRDASTGLFMVTTDAARDQAEIRETLEASVSGLDAAERISFGESASVGATTVDVELTSSDGEALAEASDAVLAALDGTPDADAPSSDLAAVQPSLEVRVDRAAAAEAGLTELQVASLVAAAGNERSIGELRIDDRNLSVFVAGGDSYDSAAELRELPIPTAAGPVPLDDLADIETVDVQDAITRSGTERVATVSLTPAEGQLGAVTAAVSERLETADIPADVDYEIGGASAQQADSFQQLGLAMLAAIAIVYILLVATFKSLMQPLILLISVPFAATGAILLMLLTGRPLAVASLIGMLMLIGIVVTNAIVLIDLVNQYRRDGQPLAEAVENGARQRLRPILMTALATICALLPMALGVTGSSGFISRDLAIVVIGGLVSSTALTLILVPVFYRLFEARKERRRPAAEREPETGLIDLIAAGQPLPSRRALRAQRDDL
ncbi:efflux RND transporter permease subunit [Zhihengliuella halotolerans]|uniref:HAE1 family hydrophobic/amphiphilic exporter-1 n=1 Tax=Zhihengliuella halotolerans TaxID=370736 RepID=A0A4Q8AE73_9MICC|nr:efflux RND transporter permease subunit [Zhihengliuella halotolerans]RZU61985.1 HAE1 family hydrophobic/amphiphilic exporter-1 [Zhihengliuella halotolerans]